MAQPFALSTMVITRMGASVGQSGWIMSTVLIIRTTCTPALTMAWGMWLVPAMVTAVMWVWFALIVSPYFREMHKCIQKFKSKYAVEHVCNVVRKLYKICINNPVVYGGKYCK